MKKALLTNLYIAKYTGSELHIIELAKLLLKREYEVTIAVQLKAYPLMKQIDELGDNITVVECQYDELKEKDYDIIIVQHYPVFDYLCCRYDITYKMLIVSKLSVISDYELLPVCEKEMDLIACVSDECAESVKQMGVPNDKIDIFKNSVEASFFSHYKKDIKNIKNNEEGKIAVISNHVPNELVELETELGKGYTIDFIGVEYEPKYVNAKFLEKYDLVITIGRTVQQCFAVGVPVYVYDYFGGPGYISKENFDLAEKNNFSGRGFEKKSSENLKKDILDNYGNNLEKLLWLRSIAEDRYSYEKNFNRIYSKVLKVNKKRKCNYYDEKEKKRIYAYSKAMLNGLSEKSIESRIYIDRGNGVCEQDSFSWQVMENYELEYNITIEGNIKSIRFDPADCPIICQILKISINGTEKKDLKNHVIKGLDYDPQCYIILDEEEKKKKIDIYIRYRIKRINDNELINIYKDMIKTSTIKNKEMQQLLNEVQGELEGIYNSRSWKMSRPFSKVKNLLKNNKR